MHNYVNYRVNSCFPALRSLLCCWAWWSPCFLLWTRLFNELEEKKYSESTEFCCCWVLSPTQLYPDLESRSICWKARNAFLSNNRDITGFCWFPSSHHGTVLFDFCIICHISNFPEMMEFSGLRSLELQLPLNLMIIFSINPILLWSVKQQGKC